MGIFTENYHMRRISTWIFYLALLELFALPFSYELATSSLLLGWILYLYKGFKYGFNWQWDYLDIPVAIFAIISLLSVLMAPDKTFSFYNYWNLVGRYLLTYYLVVQNFKGYDYSQSGKIIYVLLTSFALVVIYGACQGIFGLGLQEQGLWVDANAFTNLSTRIYSTWYNPNLLGGYLNIMLGIVAGLFITLKDKAYKIALAILFLAGFIILSLTYARGALMAMVITLGVYSGFKSRKLFFLLLILGILVLWLNPVLLERIVATTQKLDTSSEMRLAFWTSTWAMIKDHPLLGIGWGQFYEVYPHYDYYMQGQYIKIVHAHNLYLNIWAETGILGILSYLIAFGLNIYRGLKLQAKLSSVKGLALGISLGFLAMALNGLTDYVLFNVELSMFTWFLLGVITVLNRRERY